MGLREQILEAPDVASEVVEVPEWGVKIEVRGLTGQGRARVFSVASRGGAWDLQQAYPDLLILSCFDPDTGAPIFTEPDRDALFNKAAGPLERIALVALRLSAMDGTAEGEAKKSPE